MVHTLRIVGTLTLRARSDNDAYVKAERMVEQGTFGTVSWHIRGADEQIDDWQEDESDVLIEDMTEE